MLPEPATSQGPRVLVLLCEDLETVGEGLDLDAIGRGMGDNPAAQVLKARHLCRRLGQAVSGVGGAERLVLALCSRDVSQAELQTSARKAGLDPFGVEVVNLGTHCARAFPRATATQRATVLLTGAVAKARAFSGSRPEGAKPVLSWNGQVSRRTFFTLPPVHYQVLPFIRAADCAAQGGCRVCAEACPRQALAVSGDGRMLLDKARCSGCGACVSVCPRTAIEFPGASLPQMSALLEALLDTEVVPSGSRSILFLCLGALPALERLSRTGFASPMAWLPVEVPSLGMVTPAWILQCLNRGAAVSLLPCSREDCCHAQEAVIRGRVDYCRELLRLVGETGEDVKLLDPADEAGSARDLRSPLPGRLDRGSWAPRSATALAARSVSQSILGVAMDANVLRALPLTHPQSPVGLVEVREDGCTGCEACVRACPTGALCSARERDSVALTFDARLCVACGACVPACPERVLRLEGVTDVARLSQGMCTLFQDREPRCEACRARIAPRALLSRLESLLADQPAVAAMITRYCASCRELPREQAPVNPNCCEVR